MGKTILILVLTLSSGLTGLFGKSLDTLRRATGVDSPETFYILLVDASADPQMRRNWQTVRSAIDSVARGINPRSNLDIVLFDEYAVPIYSGPASQASLSAFPAKPTGKYTDWGRAVETVLDISSERKGIGIVLTVSICCVSGVDEPSPSSPYNDSRGEAWSRLSARATQSPSRLFFVPVFVGTGSFDYPARLKGLFGEDNVIVSGVTLTSLKSNVRKIQELVVKEILRTTISAELERGGVELRYATRGDQKERLYLKNQFQFLTAELGEVRSVSGRLLEVDLGGGDEIPAIKPLELLPQVETGPIEHEGERGPAKERWSYNLLTDGLWWLMIDGPDTITMNADVYVHGATEIAQLGLTLPPIDIRGQTHVKGFNFPIIGGSAGVVVLIAFFMIMRLSTRSSGRSRRGNVSQSRDTPGNRPSSRRSRRS